MITHDMFFFFGVRLCALWAAYGSHAQAIGIGKVKPRQCQYALRQVAIGFADTRLELSTKSLPKGKIQ